MIDTGTKTEKVEYLVCNLHMMKTPHMTLASIGTVCVLCLESYWALHERFGRAPK